jgi:integrase
MSLGTAGTIRVYETDAGFRAMTRVRDFDGRVRQVERHARTKGAARDALARALRDRARVDADAEITGTTKLAPVAEAWFADFQRKDRSPTTVAAYRARLDRHVLPALGNVRVREVTVGLIDRHLRAVEAKHGAVMAKQTRTVLGQVLGLAVRHDALLTNPCRETGAISTKPKKAPRALTVAQALQLMALLTYDDQAVNRDLPALVATMLATGLRVGEASAVLWDAIDFEAQTLAVVATVVRLKGQGVMRKLEPKTAAGRRTLKLPGWCAELLRERALTRFIRPADPVFPAPMGGLRDPSNTAADIKEAFEKSGFGWATSHTLRKTTASILHAKGLPANEIADQLGHTRLMQDVYLGRNVASTRAAAALETLG